MRDNSTGTTRTSISSPCIRFKYRMEGEGALPTRATMFRPRLSKTRPAPPMEETKNPPQHGENPVRMSRLDPGKIDPASRPTPMFRLCLPEERGDDTHRGGLRGQHLR